MMVSVEKIFIFMVKDGLLVLLKQKDFQLQLNGVLLDLELEHLMIKLEMLFMEVLKKIHWKLELKGLLMDCHMIGMDTITMEDINLI